MLSKLLAGHLSKELLVRQSFLATPDDGLTPPQRIKNWTLLKYHLMAKDYRKMDAYQKAMQGVVADRVVVEIGTGALAPLALIAARLGAKKVYALEANKKAAKAAQKLIKRHRFDHIIEVVFGRSEEVSIPETAEILVQELIGQMASEEGMILTMQDAIDRFTDKDTTHIPECCCTLFAPVCYPQETKISLMDRLKRKSKPAENPTQKLNVWNFPQEYFVAEPAEFEKHDFRAGLKLTDERQVHFNIGKSTSFNGFLLWNQIHFSPGNVLDTLRGTTWCAIYIPFAGKEVALLPGDCIEVNTFADLTDEPQYRFDYEILRGENTVHRDSIEFC